MSRLLPLLLLALMLLTAACKKDPVEPPLEGRWTFASQKIYTYTSTDVLRNQDDRFPNPFYMVLTGESMTSFDATTQAQQNSYQIKRNGITIQNITYPAGNWTITELTEHTLTWQTDKRPATSTGTGGVNDYAIIETKYTR